MTRSFSHYTDGAWVYLTIILKIFFALKDVVSDLTSSRASLAPTGFASYRNTVIDTNPEGARLAREGARGLNAK